MSHLIVLCVSEDRGLLEKLYDTLSAKFPVEINTVSGRDEALVAFDVARAAEREIAVVFSDYGLSTIPGDRLLEQIHRKSPGTRTVLVSSSESHDALVHAVNKAGLYRFLRNPWQAHELTLVALEALKSYESERDIRRISGDFSKLFREYELRERNIFLKSEEIFTHLSGILEARCAALSGHSSRVRNYAMLFQMTDAERRILTLAALGHNLGKLAMSDDEIAASIGKPPTDDALDRALAILAPLTDGDQICRAVVDMRAKSDKDLPMLSKLLRVAEAYDTRVNILGESRDEAIAYIRNPQVFDPELVSEFLANL
ncbi:hypothetical protein FACS1894217_13170 [Clostridia bacterium]|nr:hypothetical protein FACS1894217_13170 [Clostridia bacterium]